MKGSRGHRDRPVAIRTPEHRLRVFVSSTLKELAEERHAVREAVTKLRLAPVMFELGARPHPPQDLYRAYLAQSHVFIGIYWQSYGWVAPGMQISGLEDEYHLSRDLPALIYIKEPAPDREPALTGLLERIKDESSGCYKPFSTATELRELVENDLALLLTEYFETAQGEGQASSRVPDSLPINVPIPRSPLVGREQELETARTLLLRDDVSLVTLTGAGGIGKSRLAIEIAGRLRQQFQDGVYLVALESISDPGLVIPTIAKTLGVSELAGERSLVESLKRYLSDRQILLLLDNLEQVLPAAPQIADMLEASPRTKVLATSRAALRLRAERELPVPPLGVPPAQEALELQRNSQYSAVQLFIQRAQGVKPDFQLTTENAPAIAEICRRLDGLPLAIELASARVRMLSPQALLMRLEDRFEVLRGGTRDLPERQRTLYGAIDWSYNLLDEEDRCLLQRLSVFVGGWTFEAAETVCCAENEMRTEVLDGLEKLVGNNLVRPPQEGHGEPRLGMLETIREFAHDRLTESGESSAMHHRHAQYFATLAERAEAEKYGSARQDAWRTRLEADIDNLRATMSWALEQSQPEYVLRTAAALWRFWWTHGYWREGLHWLEQGLAGTQPVSDALRAKALTRVGWLLYKLGDHPRAITSLQEALLWWRKSGDPAGLALGLSNLGGYLLSEGDYGGAAAMIEEALELRRALSDQRGTYATLMNLGLVAHGQGHLPRAIELYNESLALARAAEDTYSMGITLVNLGDAYTSDGRYEQAEASFAEAESIFRRLGDRAGEANVNRGRGRIALKRGEHAQAFDLLAEAIAVSDELGDRPLTVLEIETMGFVAEGLDCPTRATRLLGAAESLRNEIGLRRPPVNQVDYDAYLASLRGQVDAASFTAAWAEGGAMALEEAVAYAAERPDPASDSGDLPTRVSVAAGGRNG